MELLLSESTSNILRDVVIPLISPVVTVFASAVFVYIIPARQNRRKTAMDFFDTFYSEEMRSTRLLAWKFLVTDLQSAPESDRIARRQAYVDYATELIIKQTVDSQTISDYQRVSRVLVFFALVETCLQNKTVDESMVRSILGWYYIWWRDEVLTPLRELHIETHVGTKTTPIWLNEFKYFDRLCGSPVEKNVAL